MQVVQVCSVGDRANPIIGLSDEPIDNIQTTIRGGSVVPTAVRR